MNRPLLTIFARSLALALTASALTGCDRADTTAASKRPSAQSNAGQTATDSVVEQSVYTTFYPTEYFASRIAGGSIKVFNLIPSAADPIFYKPTPEQIQAYQAASLIIVNGAGYEKWVASTSLPLARVVDTSAAFKSEFVKFKSASHSHGAGGAHTHEGIDGHTWMDPLNAKRQAEAIEAAMSRKWPTNQNQLKDNLLAMNADLDALHARIKNITASLNGATIFASHPAYNYIARRHAWTVNNVDLPPDEVPTEAQWAAVADAAAKLETGKLAVMLFESEPKSETAATLASRFGIKSVIFDPCETLAADARKAGSDYITIMNQNLDALERALGPLAATGR